MRNLKINICSLGNPLDPKTWSGTPYNIAHSLKEEDVLGKAIQSDFQPKSRVGRSLFFRTNRFYYQKSKDLQRGALDRYYRSYHLKNNVSPNSHTLHMGTLDMPFLKLPINQNHYLYCDSTWHLWSTQSTDMQGYKKRMLRDAEKLERKSYQQFKHIFTISEYVKNDLVNHYHINSSKITVVGTGLGIIKSFLKEKKYDNNKILFAAKGRFNDKGGQLVLDGFKSAYTKNPQLHLTIVGQNDYKEKIEHPGITSLGFIPLEDLQELFNTHSLFLMPAINEPWGLVYLEALANKMPIMGLNRNAFPELSGYGKFGYILKDETSSELSSQLVKVMGSPEELKQKGEAGQTYCLENFSWEKTTEKIISTIQNLT